MQIGDKVHLTGVVEEITITKDGSILTVLVENAVPGMFETVKIREADYGNID